MYSIHGYGLMVADRRTDLYADALRRAVKPGSVVVDLGAGTGIWAMYACALGAGHVYAIEPADVIGLAIEAAHANGFADRITFMQREVRDVSRNEVGDGADVLIADIRDVLPLAGASLTGMIEARRLLAPAGVLIPMRDTLWVALVHAPVQHHARVAPWDERGFGLDFRAVRRAAVSLPRKERFEAGDLVTAPAMWANLDYRLLTDATVSGHATLVATRATTAHGLAVWFESDLIDDVRMSNRPGDPPVIYGQMYFPWPDAVALESGDAIDVRLRATPAGADYIISWESAAAAAGAARQPVRFAQSTFDALPLSLEVLRRSGADAIAVPGPERDIERFLIDSFDGVRSHGDIAAGLMARFPGRFATPAEALSRVVAAGQRISNARGERDSRG